MKTQVPANLVRTSSITVAIIGLLLSESAASPICVVNSGSTKRVCVEWGQQGDPVHGTHFDVDYDCAGCSDDPDVELSAGDTGWAVYSEVITSGAPANIGSLTTPDSDNYVIKIANGLEHGAANVGSIVLTPNGAGYYSSIAYGSRISGALTGDLTVQKASGGSGGEVSLYINDDFEGDMTIPKLNYLGIPAEFSGSMVIDELAGEMRIGAVSGSVNIATTSGSGHVVIYVAISGSVTVSELRDDFWVVFVSGVAEDGTVTFGDFLGDADLEIGSYGGPAHQGNMRFLNGLPSDVTLDIWSDVGSTGVIDVTGDIVGDVTIDGVMDGEICGDNLSPGGPLSANITADAFGPNWTICDEPGCTCTAPACTAVDCNENNLHDNCDIISGESDDCNVNWTPDECEDGYPFDAELVSATPANEESLWRSQKNIMRLTFACDITAPGTGDVEIREIQSSGAFGSDLSSNFSFTVENDRILKIYETTSVLAHRKWYAILNTSTYGDWDDVACFQLQYLLQVGDADENMFVTSADLSAINAHGGPAPDDSRFDIDGNGFVTPADLSICNAHQSGYVAKPTGHDDDPCE